jgi:3-dehydroquinate dehydratase-2
MAAAMGKPIYVLSGPNLDRLGTREPEIYGATTLAEIETACRRASFPIEFRQTNSETELIEWTHEASDKAAGIVINPAAFTFTSLALLDALKMFPGPIIEIHISNIHKREDLYRRSLVSRVATGVIVGFGAAGYQIALRAMERMLAGNEPGPDSRSKFSGSLPGLAPGALKSNP